MKCENCPASCSGYTSAECNEMEWHCAAGMNEDDDNVVIDEEEEIIIGCNLTPDEVQTAIVANEKAQEDYWSGFCDFLDTQAKIENTAKAIAEAAFSAAEQIKGLESGGIEPPDDITFATAEIRDDNTVCVIVGHKHQRIGGLSDCVYHCADLSVHKEEYNIKFMEDDFGITHDSDIDFLNLAKHGYSDAEVLTLYTIAKSVATSKDIDQTEMNCVRDKSMLNEIVTFYKTAYERIAEMKED